MDPTTDTVQPDRVADAIYALVTTGLITGGNK